MLSKLAVIPRNNWFHCIRSLLLLHSSSFDFYARSNASDGECAPPSSQSTHRRHRLLLMNPARSVNGFTDSSLLKPYKCPVVTSMDRLESIPMNYGLTVVRQMSVPTSPATALHW